MNKAKRFHIFSRMRKDDLLDKALDLAEVAEALREYIDAIPDDIELSCMPGVDRDWVDSILDDA